MATHHNRNLGWGMLLSGLLFWPNPSVGQSTLGLNAPARGPALVEAARIASVERGLAQLQGLQQPNGAWGTIWKCGMTGLVLRAMLAENPAPDAAMVKAAEFLIASAQANQNGLISTLAQTNHHCVYEMALGLDALGRFQKAGGKAEGLDNALRAAAQYVVDQQNTTGGWSYGEGGADYVKMNREDMSVTWWHYHALQQVGGKLIIAGLPQALKRTEKYLTDRRDRTGGIGHLAGKRGGAYSMYTMTGPALSVLAINHARESSCTNAVKFMMDEMEKDPPDWKKNANLYTWFGNTLGLKAADPTAFLRWSKAVGSVLIANQAEDGTWPSETGTMAAATSAAAGADAVIFRSAFCVLMLQAMAPEPARR